MADEDAIQKLTFDASGARQGAFDFVAAGNQIIAANQAVVAAETKAADAINSAATRSTGARRSAAQAARDAAAIQVAAAAAGGDAVTAATGRIVTQTSDQIKAIDRVAASFDPMVAAANRAQRELKTLMDISAQGGPQGARADVLMPQGVNRANAAEANLSFGGNQKAAIDQLTAKFAPAQAAAKAMTAELAQLNQAMELGVGIEDGYTAAWDKIVAKYDEGAQAAMRASDAQEALKAQAQAAQAVANSQSQVNQWAGVMTSPGSIGGVAVSPYKSAADSASVFQEQFAAEKELADENARLAATYDPLSVASAAYAASLGDIDTAIQRNILSVGQGADAQLTAANKLRDAQLAASANSANLAFGAASTGTPLSPAAAAAPTPESIGRWDALNASMADLRATLNDGIGNVGQYAGAWDRVSASMDGYITQAQRASAVTAEQIVQARMAQDALNSQANINQLTGVQTSAGSIGGVAVSPVKSAADSASVFADAGMTADLDAQRKQVDALYRVSSQYADEYAIIQNLKKQGIYNDAQEDVAVGQLNDRYKVQLDTLGKSKSGHDQLSLATAGATREFIVLGHEVITGNFSRIPGSILVLAERMGGLETIVKSVGSFLTSPIGIGVVGGAVAIAAITAFAVAAENAAARVEKLQNALALVRPDFTAASQSAEQAAKVLAQTTFLSTPDARTGAATVYGNPAFQGTSQQAAQIASTFATLSRALGENETDWKRLGSAMQDPAATLQTLLDQNHLVGVNQALVNHAKLMQEAGDRAGAFGIVMSVIQNATAGVMTRMTPLETAMHDLSLAFVKTGQDGHSFAENVGAPINTALALVIDSLAKLVTGLRSLGEQYPKTMTLIADAIKAFPGAGLLYGTVLGGAVTPPGKPAALPPGMVPTTSYGGVAGGVSTPVAPGNAATAGPGAGGYDINVATAVVANLVSRGIPQLDAIAITAQGIAETGLNFTGPRAVGDASIQPGVDPTYGAYPGGSHGVFQWNKGRLANFMSQNQGQLPEQTSMDAQLAFAASELHSPAYSGMYAAAQISGMYAAAQSAPDLGTKTAIYTAKYEGPANVQQQIALRTGIASDLQTRLAAGGTAAPSAGAGAINPEGGPTSGFGGGTGVVNPANQTIDNAQKLADTMGITSAAAAAAQAKVDAFNKALTLQPGNIAFQEGLQKANLELYNAVPAAAAALRGINLQTDAETRMTAAWGDGAKAAAETTNQIKAETEATQFAKPGTGAWKDAVLVLTDALNHQAAATQGAQQAQQAVIDQNTIAYTQKEIDTLGMEAGARTELLSALKAQQDAELKYAQNPVAQQKAEADAASISKLTFTLQQNDAALSAVASGVSESFDTIGNAMTQSLLSGQGAAVNWANVMTSAAQQVLQQFMKLAVINPLLNSLGLGGANGLPTLETVGNAINGQAANGTGLGGMLNGTFLGNLLGVNAGAATSPTSPGSLSANDLAFASGSAATDLSQIPVPPLPVAHAGWQVGSAPPATRYVHPAYFDDAPRFHAGMTPTLAADEFPAILQRGERVITAKQDNRVLDVMGKLATQAQSAGGVPVTPPPATGQRDVFLPMLAHAETVANALPPGVASWAASRANVLHAGGIVGERPASAMRMMPSAVFAHAPRFHDGTSDDTQFTGAPGVPSAYDKIKALMGPDVVPLPSGGFAIVGAPGAYPTDTASGSGSILPVLGAAAVPLAMLLMKSGSLFSGNGLLSANSLNAAFGTHLGAGTAPTAANPFAIPPGYASDTYTPLPGAVAGVAPDAAAGTAAAADAGTAAAASSASWFDGISSWFSGLFAHEGGLVGGGNIPTRPMSLANFAILPRFHDGLGADEFLTMLQPGHRVLTAAHQASMMQSAEGMGVGAGLAAILQADPASTPGKGFPAILQHGEKTVGQGQQAAILALMGQGRAPGSIAFDGPVMPRPASGYADPVPRFHEGYGGQDLADVVTQGDRVMADRQQGAADAAASKTTDNAGHTINITLNGVGNATQDTFRRATNQIARGVGTALSRAQSRDS